MIRIIQAVMTPLGRALIKIRRLRCQKTRVCFYGRLALGRSPADENLRYDRAFWPTGCFTDR
jgi:hypothetical protein